MKSLAPAMVRMPPVIFCLTLTMRISCSAGLLVAGCPVVTNRR